MRSSALNAFLAVLTSLTCLQCGSDATPGSGVARAGQAGSSAGSSSAGVGGAASSAQGGVTTAGSTSVGAAGTAGAGASEAGESSASSGGGSNDPCSGRTICEDFEKMTLGAEPTSPFTVHKNNGTVSVDGTHVRSGKQALKVSTAATAAGSTYRQAMLAITGAPLLPLATEGVFGRFMIYTERISVRDRPVHRLVGDALGVDHEAAKDTFGRQG